jgi:hypothetical protein
LASNNIQKQNNEFNNIQKQNNEFNKIQKQKAGDMAQEVEHLPNKRKGLVHSTVLGAGGRVKGITKNTGEQPDIKWLRVLWVHHSELLTSAIWKPL